MRQPRSYFTYWIGFSTLLWFFAVVSAAAAGLPINKEDYVRAHIRPRSRLQAVTTNGSANIQYAIDDVGRFTIGTLQGDPRISSDDNKNLLFGHPFPATSDTMIEVDGTTSSIHTGVASALTQSGTTSSIDLVISPNIKVTEELSIIDSPGTTLPATVRIRFVVTNQDGSTHVIRLRTQLDTMLGNNDGAPFRLPDFAPVTTDREFDNFVQSSTVPALPSSALVFDSLQNPQIAAEFNFEPTGFPLPSRIVFGYWPVSVDQWDYTVDPTRQLLDSSVIIWWGYQGSGYGDSYTLNSGESVQFALDYGISGSCDFLSGTPFSMILCAPFELQGSVVGNTFAYSPDPAKISAFITNTANATVTGGKATLNLTPGLRLATGQAATEAIEASAGSGQMVIGDSTQIDWLTRADARVLGPRFYSLVLNGGGTREVLSRSVAIRPIPNAVYGVATDSTGQPIVGGVITVFSGGASVGTVTTGADGSYAIGGLQPGSYRVKLSAAGYPDSFFNAAVVATINDTGATGDPTAFSDAAGFQIRAYPNPVRDGPVRIAFTTDAAASGKVRIFNSAGDLITTLPADAPGAGWHEVEWDTGDAANGIYLYQVDIGGARKRGRFAVIRRKP